MVFVFYIKKSAKRTELPFQKKKEKEKARLVQYTDLAFVI